jgi:hypothetical protein
VARRGSRRITIPAGHVQDLSLAGHHLAWIDGDGRAVLYDLRRGELVRRVGRAAGRVAGLDVQADGALALGRFASGGACFSLVPFGGREVPAGCHGGPTAGEGQVGGGGGGGGASAEVAVAAGRVLYDRGSELVLQEPGDPARVIARFIPGLVRTGGFDLGEQSATWAQQRLRSGSAVGSPRVVLRSL